MSDISAMFFPLYYRQIHTILFANDAKDVGRHL